MVAQLVGEGGGGAGPQRFMGPDFVTRCLRFCSISKNGFLLMLALILPIHSSLSSPDEA